MQRLPERASPSGTADRGAVLLRDELARRLVQRQTLIEVVGPELEARYRVLLGDLQLQALEAECALRRLRRKLDLLRAALNQGRKPDFAAIEDRLDSEFVAWRLRLGDEAAKLAASRARLGAPLLSPEERRELKALFRELAKLCHPDVNPGGGEAARRLWRQASTAHANGDLDTLRALTLLAQGAVTPDMAEPGAEADRLEGIRAAVLRVGEEIEEIQTRFPFSLRDRLREDDWVAAERAAIVERRDRMADEARLLEAVLASTLREVTGG